MKHIFFVFTMLTVPAFMASGQELNVLGSAGTYTEDTGGSISWTVGEVFIVTASGTSNDITQGFHQGNIFVTGVEDLPEIAVTIFPNPTSEYVTIQSAQPLNVTIYDVSGRLVSAHNLSGEINQINVSGFSRGTYNLVIEAAGNAPRTAQLIVM